MTANMGHAAAGTAAAADHLSERLASPPLPGTNEDGWRHQSLSRGAAGVAVLHGIRAQAGHGNTDRAHAWLSLAVREGISTGPGSGLWFGAPAVAFAMQAGTPGHYPAATRALKQAVAGMTQSRLRAAHDRIAASARPSLSEFDLVRGLTGLGAYYLHCEPDHELLRQILQYLARLTEPVPAADAPGRSAPGWWSADNPAVGTTAAGGHANLAMAHGIAGPLALLALTMRKGITVGGQDEAIDRICAWLDAWQQPGTAGPWWPHWITLADLRNGGTSQAGPVSSGTQLALFSAMPGRDYSQVRFDLRRRSIAPGSPWLAWALHLAHIAGGARGWQPVTCRAMQRILVTLLASHRDGEAVAASAVREAARRHSASARCALEILAAMGILADDRPGLFTGWLEDKLAGLAPGLGSEARRWAIALHDGGPRTRPRSPGTARAYVRAAHPALLAWSARYDHLREVTRDDVLGCIAGLYGHERRSAVAALRSLFTWAKKAGVIFRNPATRIRLGKREHPVWQPLTAADLAEAVAAATTPQARLCVVLAAVHAARPGAIRALLLDDADLACLRLRLAGTSRPMGDLTCKVVREWLEYRQRRWPHTANPHLLVSKESALHHGPVSTAYLTSLRGLPATLERLRIDCQLAEAMATGFDPLHLAEVFGISEHTAIRYAVNARQLTGRAPQQAPGTP